MHDNDTAFLFFDLLKNKKDPFEPREVCDMVPSTCQEAQRRTGICVISISVGLNGGGTIEQDLFAMQNSFMTTMALSVSGLSGLLTISQCVNCD